MVIILNQKVLIKAKRNPNQVDAADLYNKYIIKKYTNSLLSWTP